MKELIDRIRVGLAKLASHHWEVTLPRNHKIGATVSVHRPFAALPQVSGLRAKSHPVRPRSGAGDALRKGSMTDLYELRIRAAQNQVLFRSINERAEELSNSGFFVSFVCECLKTDCIEHISMTHEEYEAVRAHPTRFFVVPGHVLPEVEKIIESNDRYMIVEKLGVAGEVAASDG
jgi:hypothetical protein